MKIVVYDDAKNKLVRSSTDETAIGGATSATGSYAVISEGFVNVPAGFDIVVADDIDVWMNGRLMEEGSGNDFTFDYTNDLIIWEYGLHIGDKIRIRRY